MITMNGSTSGGFEAILEFVACEAPPRPLVQYKDNGLNYTGLGFIYLDLKTGFMNIFSTASPEDKRPSESEIDSGRILAFPISGWIRRETVVAIYNKHQKLFSELLCHCRYIEYRDRDTLQLHDYWELDYDGLAALNELENLAHYTWRYLDSSFYAHPANRPN